MYVEIQYTVEIMTFSGNITKWCKNKEVYV